MKEIKLILVVFILFLVGCQREDEVVNLKEEQGVSLEEAREFFEKQELEKGDEKKFTLTPKWETFTQGGINNNGNAFAYVNVVVNESFSTNIEILFVKKEEGMEAKIVLRREANEHIGNRMLIFNLRGDIEETYYVDNQKENSLTGGFVKKRSSLASRNTNAELMYYTHEGGDGDEKHYEIEGVVVEGTPTAAYVSPHHNSFFGEYNNTAYFGFVQNGSNGGGGGGAPKKKEDKVEDRLTDKCAKNILNQMRSATGMKNFLNEAKLHGGRHNFSEMILDLFEKSSQTHLVFENGTIETGANGATTGTTIRLDNGYLRNATQLSIARTIIHEMVHAYLNVNYQPNYPDVRDQNMYNYLRSFFNDPMNTEKYGQELGRHHHEFMAQYIDAMATSLQQWDMRYGSQMNLGFEYYRAMAFAGLAYRGKDSNQQDILIDTDSFKELVPNEADRNKIKEIIKNEQKGNKDAKGTKCK